jgi:hypothetical protein
MDAHKSFYQNNILYKILQTPLFASREEYAKSEGHIKTRSPKKDLNFNGKGISARMLLLSGWQSRSTMRDYSLSSQTHVLW